MVNLTQLQARLEDLREWDYLPIGVCPENIFALNFLALSLDIDFPLISDYSLKLSDELGLRLEGDTDYSPKVCDAVIAIGRQGEVDYTYCSESRETDFDLDYIIDNLPQKRCDYCDGQ